MATIQFENGMRANFEGNPTPQDVDFVAQKLGITPKSQNKPKEKTGLEKTGGIINSIFPGEKIGEAIGTSKVKSDVLSGNQKGVVEADYSKLSPQAIERLKSKGVPTTLQGQREETAQGIKGPSAKEIAGDVAQIGLMFTPIGRVEAALSKGLSSVAPKLAGGILPKLGTGLATGYGFDVATNMKEDKENVFKPGIGTLVGGSIPLAGPAIKGLGKLGGEALGASTGTGFGSIKQGLESSMAGGKGAEAFRQGLRGKVNPEQLVEEAKDSLGQIISNRTKSYQSQLSKLKTNTKQFDTTPIVEKFNKLLEDFRVTFTKKGIPDFSRSPKLRRYETDLGELSKVLAGWGKKEGDTTLVGVDRLKQVIDDFRIGSPDSTKFDSFVQSLRSEAKKIIKNEPGYDKLVSNYENSTDLIKDIQKGLSLGDKASTDTAFRKLTTVLRTNNEFRKQLVDELDKVAGGTLKSKIAGQQLNELLPRGLQRIVTGGGAGIATLGGFLVPFLKLAVLTSPRIVGEAVNALGLTLNKANVLKEAITKLGISSPGELLLNKLNK